MPTRPVPATTARRHDDRHGETAAFWSRRAGRPVTLEEARSITENLTGFISVLLEWQIKEVEVASPAVRAAHHEGGPM